MKQTTTRILGEMLWLCNNSNVIGMGHYAMKQRILERYATAEPDPVWQCLVHGCWSCGGQMDRTGIGWDGRGQVCWRCSGSGEYARRYVRHIGYRLGRRRFLVPQETRHCRPPASVSIEGRVERTPVGLAGFEATCWLALVFDRRLLRRLLTSGMHCRWSRYPFCNLRRLIYLAREPWRSLRRRWLARRRKVSMSNYPDDMPF